jgi:hypothetical protein
VRESWPIASSSSRESALRAYERAGFREIGRRRDAVLERGVRHDSILMDAIPG